MIPERFGRAVNQYFLGLGSWLMIIFTAWPAEVIDLAKVWLGSPPNSGSIIGLVFLVTGPIISLGAAVESLARVGGMALVKGVEFFRRFYKFSYRLTPSSSGLGHGRRRRHSAVVFGNADSHIFDWVTGHLIRGKFGASWTIMWILALIPTWRLNVLELADLTTTIALSALEMGVAVLLFVWSLHQLSVYDHYLAPEKVLLANSQEPNLEEESSNEDESSDG